MLYFPVAPRSPLTAADLEASVVQYQSCRSFSQVEPQSEHESLDYLDPHNAPSIEDTGIRGHLEWWQKQQDPEPILVNLHHLPGFNLPGNTQNAVSQFGEPDPGASSTTDEADLLLGSEPQVDSEGQVEDDAHDRELLCTGDMVMIVRSQTQIPGVFIRSIDDMSQIYTIHGEILLVNPRRIFFAVQAVVPPEVMAPRVPLFPISISKDEPGKPKSSINWAVSRDVGSPLIERMLQLTSSADECYRKYASKLDHVWEILVQSNAPQVSSIEEIAAKIFQTQNMSTITAPMLWCLHRAMLHDERFLVDGRWHRVAPRYGLLSQTHRDDRLMVMGWIRDYQENQASDTTASYGGESDLDQDSLRANTLSQFIRKAQKLIRKSREVRSLESTDQLGPSNAISLGVEVDSILGTKTSPLFSSDDIKILRCFIDWVLTRRIPASTSTASIGPAILRALGTYDGLDLEKATGLLLLKELGVIAPWEDRMTYKHEFPMPGLGVDPILDEMQNLASAPNLILQDSMKDLRKDWGDLPVFCIDSLSTVEIDDGVSWEAAGDNSSWVHIHVANPSAFINTGSIIAKYAARLSSTLYLIERTHYMLESNTLRKHCSLAPGCPSLTFSARMDSSGNILDTQVTHGILHNIRYLTPESISKCLYSAENSSGDLPIITVGGKRPVQSTARDQTMNDSEIAALFRLKEIGSARRSKRNAKMLFGSDFLEPSVSLGDCHPPFGLNYGDSRRILGDPIIAMPIKPYDSLKQADQIQSSGQFVSDLMLLAGEVAAKWSAERGIPIAFSGNVGDSQLKAEREVFEREVMQPALEKHGLVPRQYVNRYIQLAGHTASSTTPLEHIFLNLSAYCKATSPLRRWGDLFTHWQIDAAVRYEATTGESLIGNTEDHFLPFTRIEAAEALKRYDMTLRHSISSKRQSRQHWIAQWFYRAYYHEDLLPKTLTAYVSRIDNNRPTTEVLGIIKELSINCVMVENTASRFEGGLSEGDSWEVEVSSIDTFQSSIRVNPLRLVEKSIVEPLKPRVIS